MQDEKPQDGLPLFDNTEDDTNSENPIYSIPLPSGRIASSNTKNAEDEKAAEQYIENQEISPSDYDSSTDPSLYSYDSDEQVEKLEFEQKAAVDKEPEIFTINSQSQDYDEEDEEDIEFEDYVEDLSEPILNNTSNEKNNLKVKVSDVPTRNYGAYVKELRLQNNLTIQDIAEKTKIRSTYLEALEDENYDTLPPAVYVLAYVKTLCSFYNLDEVTTEDLTSEIRKRLEYEAPEDPSKTLVDIEFSEENAILLKRIFIIIASVIFIIVAIITFSAFALFSRSSKNKNTDIEAVDLVPAQVLEQRLLNLQDEPNLEATELSPNIR